MFRQFKAEEEDNTLGLASIDSRLVFSQEFALSSLVLCGSKAREWSCIGYGITRLTGGQKLTTGGQDIGHRRAPAEAFCQNGRAKLDTGGRRSSRGVLSRRGKSRP